MHSRDEAKALNAMRGKGGWVGGMGPGESCEEGGPPPIRTVLENSGYENPLSGLFVKGGEHPKL